MQEETIATRKRTNEVVAAGIVYSLGRAFLSDDSHEPYMRLSDLCEKIGVSQSNASSKSREIWYRLNLIPNPVDLFLVRHGG